MAQLWQQSIDSLTTESDLWSLFHENSKTSRYDAPISNAQVLARMRQMWDVLPYEGCETYPLPEPEPADGPLSEAILNRVTARNIAPVQIPLKRLSTLLRYAYGVTRENEDGSMPRPFRTVPSGGALYPLEIYFHTSYVDDLPAGLYHFDPRNSAVQLIQNGDSSPQIGDALVQPGLSVGSSIVFFITAIFERSTFKYNSRGYRFALLEAGHVAQNINLTATSLQMGVVNIGGFFDREIDRFLQVDGITQSTIYMLAVGG
ncbi:MAG TPA: SagB/ThcOx family dehydrogenase [Bryobacteraceae bacterium]|jgi:SagB-type dehydrogenase family enzyme